MKTTIKIYQIALLVWLLMVSIAVAQEQHCDDCGISRAEIEAHPEPDVTALRYDERVLHDRAYKQVIGRIDIYDAPNGNILRSLDAGFNFLTSINSVDGWTEVNQGEWVKTEHLRNSNGVISYFTGVLLPEEPLPYTMAWLLVNLYPSKTPGGEPNEAEYPLTYRYTRVYIYDMVEIDGWRWYQIGVDKWVHQTQVAKVQPIERPEGVTTERWIAIDLYEQTLIAYDGDTPVFASLIATGLPRWPTREGIFNIYWRRLREDMSWGTPGDDFYYLEEVPWTMFFDEGRAIHGAYWHDGFGYRRSHGCVNLSITDAKWLFEWVAEGMGSRASADIEEGPNVYVYSSGEYQ
ncbi:MAG: L,D-transpeptidase [Anaerolineae bacterium]|jgi:hypothetical protein|nr:L,D-transpeptidase [Anaerolineae bacterium]